MKTLSAPPILIKQLLALACMTPVAYAAVATKAATGTDLTAAASWSGGSGPGFPTSADVATWDSSSLGAGLTAATAVNWGSINVTGALTSIGISGAGQITTGDITLAGSETLTIANPIALSGNSAYSIADVTGSAGNDVTLSGVISGTGFGITKSGAGTLTLSNSGNSFTGLTTISGGRLIVTGRLGTQATPSSAFVDAGGTLEFNSASYDTDGEFWSGALTGTGTVEINNAMQRFRGNNGAFAGTVHILTGKRVNLENVNSGSASAAWVVDATGLLTTQVANGTFEFGSLSGGGTLQTGGTGTNPLHKIGALNTDTTFSGVIGTTVNLEKVGTGSLTLSGTNTHTGTTTLSAGTLNLSNSLALQNSTLAYSAGTLVLDQSVGSNAFTFGGLSGTSAIALQNNAGSPAAVALTVGGNNATTAYSGNLSGGGSLTKNGTGALTLSGTSTYAGTTTVNGGTLEFVNRATLYNAVTGNWTAANLTVASGATAAFGVGGAGEFDATDIGNLIALTNVADGVPATQGFTNGSRIGFDTTNAAGGVFTYANAITDHVAGATTDTLGLAKLGTGTLTLTGTNTYTGTTTIAGGTLELSSAANQSLGGIISGAGALTKSGAGTLTLNAANTYTGGITINGGTLAVGASGTVGGNTNTITVGAGNSVTLDLLGTANKTVTSGIITINTGSQLTIARSGFIAGTQASTTFSGALSGAGSLVLGTITGTANTTSPHRRTSFGNYTNFTGDITVESGANFLPGTTTVNSNNLTLATGAHVTLSGGTTATFGILSGGGIFTKDGGGTTATLSVASGTFSGMISSNALLAGGSTTLIKATSGTLTLSGASTYTGGTTINAGTLLANNDPANSATGTGTVTVKDTATLGGTGRVSGAVILESGGTLAPGTSIESLATGALTIPAGATLAAEISSSGTPLTDSVAVTGNLTLGGNLTVTDLAPAALTPGTKLTLMTYTGTLDGTNGAFSGKPEGSTFAVGSNTFKIRYADGGKNVTLEAVAAGTGYAGWASTNAPGQTDVQDYDNDGVSNGVEWVLGGSATTNDLGKLPTLSTAGGNFTFTFFRDQDSKTADTAVSIQVGTNLDTWTTYPVPDSGTLGPVTVTDNGNGTDTVILVVTQAPDPKKFGRLNVTITP
jgi:fibronectin-binding autotransporter adhesin